MKIQLSKEGTTSDLISRQAAIKALHEQANQMTNWAEIYKQQRKGILTATNIIKDLPSVQPEPKEGHWILHETSDGGEQYECSECGVLWEFNDGTPEDNEAFYCPKCGVKMKGEQDGH